MFLFQNIFLLLISSDLESILPHNYSGFNSDMVIMLIYDIFFLLTLTQGIPAWCGLSKMAFYQQVSITILFIKCTFLNRAPKI